MDRSNVEKPWNEGLIRVMSEVEKAKERALVAKNIAEGIFETAKNAEETANNADERVDELVTCTWQATAVLFAFCAMNVATVFFMVPYPMCLIYGGIEIVLGLLVYGGIKEIYKV